ncbi:MAG: hypothetical protein F6J86_12860 [Symploca sp. SIO1B1]|nr:hypothetical protein [Symploca sp. SIO1C2]NER50150.1 hypothetical protein [Symploca sp. SIO1A3]NER94710.1 hypothetical protein [Symploca sp. SIO1B1]
MPELIIIIGAVIVSWLVFTWLVKVVKASMATGIVLTIIVLLLQLVFDVKVSELLQEIIQLPQTIWQLVN